MGEHSNSLNPAENILKRCPGPVISREVAAHISGGLVTAKSLANLDSLGVGVPGRLRCGRKIGYPAENFARWLSDRLQPIQDKQE